MDGITELLKRYMQEQQIPYEEIAKKTGWTRQNVWDKLNKRSEPNLENTKRIAESMGFHFSIIKLDEEPEQMQDAEKLFEAVEMEQVSYSLTEKILNSIGYSLKIIPPEK